MFSSLMLINDLFSCFVIIVFLSVLWGSVNSVYFVFLENNMLFNTDRLIKCLKVVYIRLTKYNFKKKIYQPKLCKFTKMRHSRQLSYCYSKRKCYNEVRVFRRFLLFCFFFKFIFKNFVFENLMWYFFLVSKGRYHQGSTLFKSPNILLA